MARHFDMTDERLYVEKMALEHDKEFYLKCMDGKTLRKRKTMEDQRQGLILFGMVYLKIRIMSMTDDEKFIW